MFGSETCPRCMQEIAPERLMTSPKVCDCCGHVIGGTSAKATQKQFERNSMISVIAAAIVIVAGFLYIVNWGGYSLEVLPLQAASLIGMDSPAGNERMAQICLEVKKLDCTEQMYMRVAFQNKGALIRLAKFQFNRMKYAEAAESYRQFFSSGAQDLDSAYLYARALGELGRVDEAAKYYDFILASKPDTLQITVASNYVKMLVQHGRLDQSLKVIDGIRHRGDSAKTFMDSEYKVIEEKLGKQKS